MWTMDNTEGHTQAELNAANAIVAKIKAEHDGIDESNIDGALTNTYQDGIDEAAWEAKVKGYLGIQ